MVRVTRNVELRSSERSQNFDCHACYKHFTPNGVKRNWECLIGLGLLTNRFMRATLFLLFLQMIGAGAPLVLFPNEAFEILPIAPTLEGQYILENLVLVSAGIVIGATVGRRTIGGAA